MSRSQLGFTLGSSCTSLSTVDRTNVIGLFLFVVLGSIISLSMTRIPLTVYLTILAGIVVVFNHCASSETGDVALNKVTGAAGRFYTLFHDAVTALYYGCTSHLETTFCGPNLGGFLPHDARLRYCHAPVHDSESRSGTLNGRDPAKGFGNSDSAFVYYQPLNPRQDLFWQTRASDEHHQSRAVWDWSSEIMMTIGTFLLRVWASWW